MRVAACLLAFVTSTLAYRVLSPNSQTGWTNQGNQLLTWERVSSDKTTFSVVLDNQQMQGFSRKLLASRVDGTKGKVNLSPPSGGWPTGSNFRVNLVASADQFDTIYAQSNDFVIKKVAAAAVDPSAASTGTESDPASEYDPTAEDVPASESNPTPGYTPSQGALTGSRPTGSPNSGSTTPYAATESAISPVENNSLPNIPNSAASNLCFSSGLLGLSLLLFFALV
ncbi:hypothetical protein BJ912DRAFT_39255 [Pholiota molesta]|nr:hypothetical protein BJ912DRAFT_39255 [Pholiota molesta]